MSDPNRPYDPVYGEQNPPPAVPRQQYPPAGQQPLPSDAPVPAAYPPARGDTPVQPATSGTEDPRLGLEVGRYWAGAFATIVVAALIGLVAAFIIGDVLDLDMQSPPDLFGSGSDLVAWTVIGGLFALLAAVVLHLLVLSTPRPRTFFGWVIALATVILAVMPFAGDPEIVPAAIAALVWIVLGIAVWSLLTGVLSRTLVQRHRSL